jgi:hypothetical protein
MERSTAANARQQRKLFVKSGRPLLFFISKEMKDGPRIQVEIEVKEREGKSNAGERSLVFGWIKRYDGPVN